MLRIPFIATATLLLALPAGLRAQQATSPADDACAHRRAAELPHSPIEAELRCRFGAEGPGRFGLLSYVDVPVYQPATPMPGTHVVGVPGHARPYPTESYEEWEWRVLRTEYGPEAHRVYRGLEVLDPRVALLIMRLESRLTEEGIRFQRRETWRAPERQAFLFQQGRSRPGPLATSTLTSWHSQVSSTGLAAGRAVDYDVPTSQMPRFHELAWTVGLQSFGHDSNDPGHVFLPEREELPRVEVARLRALPRVPEVTLATGLPVDRRLPPGGRAALRAAAVEFASLPFIPYVPATLVPPAPPSPVPDLKVGMAEVATALSVPPQPASAGGDAPRAPRRSARSAAERKGRNRDR